MSETIVSGLIEYNELASPVLVFDNRESVSNPAQTESRFNDFCLTSQDDNSR